METGPLSEVSMSAISAGSHSRIVVFEQCKRHAEIKYVERVPEPKRPLPPGKTEHANDRGTRIHAASNAYVQGGVELIHELRHFAAEHDVLRDEYAQKHVSMEGEWAFDRDWLPVAWMSSDVWLRIKLDYILFMSGTDAVVIDVKSGKRFGNEIKHGEQMKLYQLASFVRFPDLETITVELWYTDLDELHSQSFTREQGLRFMKNWEDRIDAMTTCEDFPPNPNRFTCKWCPYKPVHLGGTGHCEVGV